MVENCPAEYKNLNEIQSFSEQMYPTVQWAEQNCKNDEWLKKKVEELEYLTPPAVRKRFSPILLDPDNSWGCQLNSGEGSKKDTVTFNDDIAQEIVVDFTDFNLIDENKSDCAFESIPVKTNGVITSVQMRAAVPMVEESPVNYDCKTYSPGDSINSYWYVGQDKAKSYQVRPDWLNDIFDEEIPSVVRAQTFTIPNGISSGKLESVDLFIENNGTTTSNWGSPLIIQIWKTKQKKVEKTTWNKSKKKAVSYNPKQYEYIAWPDGNPRKPLAQSIYYPEKTNPHFQNFLLDKAITVNAGEKYAIVAFSPLSHYEHCPRIGGWGRNCARDAKYAGGDAFLSENNGRKFIRYGRNDLKVAYKFGQLTPQDFAFQCHIRTYTSGRDTTEEYFLYLQPIKTNPIREVQINPVRVGGNENSNNNELIFEVSPTGKPNSWLTLDGNYKARFTVDSQTGEYPHTVFVRARMKAALPSGSSTTEVTPYIEKFIVNLTLESPTEMYARTHFYTPKLSPMLGANVWGRVYAPFVAEPGVTGSVEIIQESIFTEHFTIITAEDLPEYAYIDGLDSEKINDEDLSVRYQYLIDSPIALNLLKNEGVYVKPYTYTSNGVSVTDLLSFKDGIQFTNSPAYPIKQCLLQADGNTEVQAYAEGLDYTFDYDNDILNFYSDGLNDVISDLPVGNLSVMYNPIFIQDLTNDEVGLREDGEGLILDYFKETFIVSDENLENRSVQLRVNAVDPIRQVLLNGEELHEDTDFTVDYINHTIN
uniref:hypothetical protein n=1 Tax=Methanobrevibacter sp. TaxID=66852 RepID=UPI00386C5BD6